MSAPIFYVHVDARGVTGELRLNDAPVMRISKDHRTQAFPTISEWVINGENLLSVHVEDSDEGARLHLALCRAQIGDVPEPGNELEHAVIDWPPAPAIPVPGAEDIELPAAPALPPLLTAGAVVSHPWGDWAWQRSPAFASDARTVTHVVTWLRALHAALVSGQIDTLVANSRVNHRELALAYAMDPDEFPRRLRQAWGILSGQTGWALAPFDEADLDLRVRCGGQLVEPTTREGEPILRQARPIDGESWSLPIFIARTNFEYTDGELTIAR